MSRPLVYTPAQRSTFIELIAAYEAQVLEGIALRLGDHKPDPITHVILRAIYRLNVRGNPGTVPHLAVCTGLSQPTVWRRIQALEQGGHVRTTPHRGVKGRDIWMADDIVEKGSELIEQHMDHFRVFLTEAVAAAAGDPLAGKIIPFAPGLDQLAPKV